MYFAFGLGLALYNDYREMHKTSPFPKFPEHFPVGFCRLIMASTCFVIGPAVLIISFLIAGKQKLFDKEHHEPHQQSSITNQIR